MSEIEQFDTAVRLVHSLPKDGPFQPSNEMKLKLYGLYKQATSGSCSVPRPAFWDVVGRAKWNAWQEVCGMSKEDAMKQYVDSIKEVVDTMSLTESVEDFLRASKNMDEKNLDTTEALVMALVAPEKGFSARSGHKSLPNGHSDHADKDVEESGNCRVNGEAEVTSRSTSEDDLYKDAIDIECLDRVQFHPLAVTVGDVAVAAVINGDGESATSSMSSNVTTPHENGCASVTARKNPDSEKSPKGKRSNSKKPRRDDERRSGSSYRDYESLLEDAWRSVAKSRATRNGLQETPPPTPLALTRSVVLRAKKKSPKSAQPVRRSTSRGSRGAMPEPTGTAGNGQGHAEDTGGTERNARQGASQSRDHRDGSGNSSRTSSASVELLEFDPQISDIMLRLHQDMRDMKQRLDLIENLLISQQHLMRETLNVLLEKRRSSFDALTSQRLAFSVPWKLLFFVIVWPIAVNLAAKLVRSGALWRFIRRRRR